MAAQVAGAGVDKQATITIDQLATHKDQQSLWVAVHGKVYDLTSFAKDHPGGIDVLTDCAGQDATESFEYAGHTEAAIEVMQKFRVGRLEGNDDDSNDNVSSNILSKTKDLVDAFETVSKDSNSTNNHNNTTTKINLQPRNIAMYTLYIVGLLLIRFFILPSSSSNKKNTAGTSSSTSGMLFNNNDSTHLSSSSSTLKLTTQASSTLAATTMLTNTTTKTAFLTGLILASSLSMIGYLFLYVQFSKTLVHERDVWSFPSVIPAKRKTRRRV